MPFFVYEYYLCTCFNKSVLNRTFCRLLYSQNNTILQKIFFLLKCSYVFSGPEVVDGDGKGHPTASLPSRLPGGVSAGEPLYSGHDLFSTFYDCFCNVFLWLPVVTSVAFVAFV